MRAVPAMQWLETCQNWRQKKEGPFRIAKKVHAGYDRKVHSSLLTFLCACVCAGVNNHRCVSSSVRFSAVCVSVYEQDHSAICGHSATLQPSQEELLNNSVT